MNKKSIVQLIVVVLAFGGSGLVLYNGLLKNSVPSSPASLTANVPAVADNGASLLPYGDQLNWDGLYKQRIRYGDYGYPKLSTSTEVGVPVQNLIKPFINGQ